MIVLCNPSHTAATSNRLRDATFEDNTLTGTKGANSVVGTMTIDSTTPMKGLYSAKVAAVSSYLRFDPTASGVIFVSEYVRVDTTIATGNPRFLELRNTALLCALQASSTVFRLAKADGTAVGTGYTYTVGTRYRVGLEYRKGTGANAIARFYIATGDNAFGSAQAEITTDTSTVDCNLIRNGCTTSTAIQATFDDIRIDTISMPGPSA